MKGSRAPFIYFVLTSLSFVAFGSVTGLGGHDGQTSSCGELRDIRYPFCLKNSSANCGDPSYELVCSGNNAVMDILSGKYLVKNIFYESSTIQIVSVGLASGSCSLPIQSLTVSIQPKSFDYLGDQNWATFYNCSKKIKNNIYRPIPCLSQNNRFVYVGSGSYVQGLLPSCSYLTMFPIPDVNITTGDDDVFQILRSGFSLSWGVKNYTKSMIIHQCLRQAERYVRGDLDEETHFLFFKLKAGNKFKRLIYPFQFEYEFVECIKNTRYFFDGAYALYGLAVVLVVFLDIAAFLLVLSVLGRFILAPLTIILFLAYKLQEMLVPVDTIEKFLRTQQTLMPTSYHGIRAFDQQLEIGVLRFELAVPGFDFKMEGLRIWSSLRGLFGLMMI